MPSGTKWRPGSAPERKAAAPRRSSLGELAALIAPHPPSRFLRDIWEKSPLLVKRREPDRYRPLLSLDAMDTLLSMLGPNPARKEIRLVRSAEGKLEEKQVEINNSGFADSYRLYAAYHDGYTLVLNAIDRRWPALALLCRRLESELRHTVGANVYFTPARSQGFLPHFDGHDVFILQVEGAKTWRVFRPTVVLPLEDTPSDLTTEQLQGTAREFRLNAGDLLYIPRGFVHDAMTSDTSSIHVTIGVHPLRWADVLIDAVRRAANSDVSLRAAFPAPGAQSVEQLASELRRLLGRIAEPAVCRETVRLRMMNGYRNGNPVPDGHFRSLDRLREIALDTALARRSGMSSVVAVENGRAVIRFRGNAISGPKKILPVLQFVDQANAFTVRDLPGALSDSSKVVLASRLVREGLFAISAR